MHRYAWRAALKERRSQTNSALAPNSRRLVGRYSGGAPSSGRGSISLQADTAGAVENAWGEGQCDLIE